jgi:hypothetical protein
MDRENHNLNEAAESSSCSEWEPLLMLFAAGEELDPAEEANVTEHLAHCERCRAALGRERALLSGLAENRFEPDAALLAGCRAKLRDALDREEEKGWLRRRIGALVPTSWISPRPAWSAALLLLLGFSAGIFGPRLMQRYGRPVAQNAPPAPVANTASTLDTSPTEASLGGDASNSALSAIDLHTASVSGINVIPAGTGEPPQVQLQLQAQQPVTVQGTVDNNNVKQLLMYVLNNSSRFDPDVRINAVDLLRTKTDDPAVRSVLCHAAHTDGNTAVRLKALEALDGAEPQKLVRETLLDALNDQNPGVRIEAINALQSMAAKGQVVSDDHMLSVLRNRMLNDPNTYIRMQSAAVFRDLGPRQKF